MRDGAAGGLPTQAFCSLETPMNIETRGPYTKSGTSWDVYVDGRALPGYIERLDGRYRVHLGGMRGMPWPPFATLEEAAQALADEHAR
jgi:hypothetical protein